MTSICISKCINDARVPIVRATYTNLYKWPESDAEFVRSVSCSSSNGGRDHPHPHPHPKVVDSISCRQLYLRSYTFSRKRETVPEKITKKCFGGKRVNQQGHDGRKKKTSSSLSSSSTSSRGGGGRRRRKCLVIRKVKEMSCAAWFCFFNRLLSCTASVDVVDH